MSDPEELTNSFDQKRFSLFSAAGPARRDGGRIGTGIAVAKIAVFTVLGIALPNLYLDLFPRDYRVETRLKVQSADADAKAVADAVAGLRSKAHLDGLIRALDLGRASEFAVDRTSTMTVVSDIVSRKEMTVGEAEARLRNKLAEAIAVHYDAELREVSISVTAEKPDEAARIANTLGDMFRTGIAASGFRRSDPNLEHLQRAVEKAESDLSGFIKQNDGAKLAQLRRAESEERALGAQVAGAEAELAAIRRKVAQASAMTLDDVLEKPLPDSLEFTSLDYQRQRHVEARMTVDQLSGDLGPRHPRLLAAQAALDSVRSDIRTTLKQVSSSLKEQEKAAAARLAELQGRQQKKPAADQKTLEAAKRLTVLEEQAEQARSRYLQASSLSREMTRPASATASVVSEADIRKAALLGPTPLMLSGIGGVAGFLFGAFLAFFTRRRREEPDAELTLAFDEPLVLSPLIEERPEEPSAWHEPDQDEPVDEADISYRPARYPSPANDMPLDDRIRTILMANRVPASDAPVPSLLDAVLEGRISEAPAWRPRHVVADQEPLSEDEMRRQEEVLELRRDLAALRERVQSYSSRRAGSAR